MPVNEYPPLAPGSETSGPGHEVEFIRDVRIPTAEPGVTLSGDMYLPIGAGVVPALVTVVPYRKDASAGIMYGPDLQWFASRGYATLLVDFRGTGSSDGEQRPPFDPDEAEDGVAAVEWAAAQPWCTGNVGMWGHSYGAIMSMRTASRRPPHLKAIIPVMGTLDPERDFVHPAGCLGGFAPLPYWATETLLNQLLPPLNGHGTVAEQRRWRHRLNRTEPWLLDLFRHGPGDPIWRRRVVDASAITASSFCIAGWRDLFCDGTIRAFERIDAPKKLLVGPWMHTMPHTSPFDPIDFRALALRWWDRWLRGIDNGVTEEPPVTLHVQGDEPHWRQFAGWPPPSEELVLSAAGEGRLTALGTSFEPKTTPTVSSPHANWIRPWGPRAGYGLWP